MHLIVRTENKLNDTLKALSAYKPERFAISQTKLKRVVIPEGFEGLIVTSSESAPAISQTKLPIFCVGETTRRALEEAGFRVVMTGKTNVEDLAKDMVRIYPTQRLIHVAGDVASEEWYKILEEAGYQIEKVVSYETVYVDEIPHSIADLIKNYPDLSISFYSYNGAKLFCDLIRKSNIDISQATAITLSEQVASGLQGFKQVRIAQSPNIEGIIEKLDL